MIDEDVVIAAADLCARAGAQEFEIGHAGDDETDWWCSAKYRGARVTVEHFAMPDKAAEALAVRLLTGAKCGCGKLVRLGFWGAVAFTKPVMADGKPFPIGQAAAAGQCQWKREGRTWVSECGAGRG